MQGKALTYQIHSLLNAPKIHTDLLWDLTLLFVSLSVSYFFFIFFLRNRLQGKTSKVLERKKSLAPMISEFLFFEENTTENEKRKYVNLKIEIRELIKDDFNRKVLSGILLDLQKDVSGLTKKRVFKLYQELGLQEDAYTKLKSWRWEVVSQGILELTQMQVTEAYSSITKFINDKRGVIRKQAEIATVTLKHEGIGYFLDTTNYKISEWQQLKLLDVIRSLEGFQPPKFKAWLTSGNRYVVLFALRLIKYYNQNDAYASIVELVKHSNDQIKSEAIGCIREFHILEARQTLKLVFWKCSTDIQLLILDTLAVFGQNEDVLFLQHVENKETNFSVKSKALSAINVINPESILPTVGIMNLLHTQIPEDIHLKSQQKHSNSTPSKGTIFPHESDNSERLSLETEDASSSDPDQQSELVLHKDLPWEFNFIPLVVENEVPKESISDLVDNVDEVQLGAFTAELAIEVEEKRIASNGQLNFDFLPFVFEENARLADTDVTLNTNSGLFENETLQFPVIFEEVQFTAPCVQEEEQIKETAENAVAVIENIVQSDLNFTPTEESSNTELAITEFQIPQACFNEDVSEVAAIESCIDQELSIIELLDAIEEFGDKRELPLLQEMRNKKEVRAFRTTIEHLIARFSLENHDFKKKDGEIKENSEELYSVFEEFYGRYDTDSKLLLLEEIGFVGDRKELRFLSKLLHDPNIKIRDCAKRVHGQLQKRLGEEQDEIEITSNHDIALNKPDEQGLEASIHKCERDADRADEKGIPLQKNNKVSNELLPLEFCFLVEALEVKPPKVPSVFDVDFELDLNSPEYHSTIPDVETEIPLVNSEQEKSIMHLQFPFSPKTKNKDNG